MGEVHVKPASGQGRTDSAFDATDDLGRLNKAKPSAQSPFREKCGISWKRHTYK